MAKLFPVDYDLNLANNPDVEKNEFRKLRLEGKTTDNDPIPTFQESKKHLPVPFWQGHQSVTDAYWRAWELAFSNILPCHKEAGFVSDFIDSAFSDYLFMWDSCFAVQYGRYAARSFDFQKTLNNFYANQHRDGFICREMCQSAPGGQFSSADPVSTGPNVLAWCEWNYYTQTEYLLS